MNAIPSSGTRISRAPDPHTALAERRALLHDGMRRAVAELSDEIRPIITYHLGWTDPDGRPASGDAGKCLRGCLTLLSAEAVGATPEIAVPGAVAVELVHNFSLLHDDIVDLDRERRHRPSAWTVFGVGPTIVAGDVLLMRALDVLGGTGNAEAAVELATATSTMIEGQAVDLSYQVRRDVAVDDVLTMSEKKTAALIGCSTSLGALLGGGSPDLVATLRDFGTALGIAFQAIDDILGTWGDPAVTGKDVGGDVRRRKLTLPLSAAMGRPGVEATELRTLMNNATDLTPAQVARAIHLIEHCGGRQWTERCANRHHQLALAALAVVDNGTDAWRLLSEVGEFAVGRSY
ncbi:polyprenyl synthetase family protein [Nocardia sp. NBC_00508]|uniref:polyprenyl synthetase family protein n=1 Tax=Nocardia sp. NBC_00508 TaxID=2975992 RepID=UPI002E81DD90|nr:polyprenyl synthetase family protein [Nocardia sp. NBC_00508]WUD66555.1 polyprenyl synthetase family protein [Nocardia sp. NBC_00508]